MTSARKVHDDFGTALDAGNPVCTKRDERTQY